MNQPRTIEYARAVVQAPVHGDVPLLLDLYLPAGEGPFPLAVLVHGGGFYEGSRTDEGMVRIGTALAGRGIAAASIDYRLRDQ